VGAEMNDDVNRRDLVCHVARSDVAPGSGIRKQRGRGCEHSQWLL
jgi:hypothetical protein